jgi:sirohydrochlorin cobaltochelatase
MFGADDHRHRTRLQMSGDGVRDLRRQAFLKLRTARKCIYGAGDLAEPDDTTLRRQVGHLCGAIERQQVMFAHAGELDVADQDEIIAVRAVFEHAPEMPSGVFMQTPKQFRVGPRDAVRRIAKSVSIGIFADSEQDLTHGVLDAKQIEPLAFAGLLGVLRLLSLAEQRYRRHGYPFLLMWWILNPRGGICQLLSGHILTPLPIGANRRRQRGDARMGNNGQTTEWARLNLASGAGTERTLGGPVGRAVVLVGHGGVPRNYPRERLTRLRGLETRRRGTGAPPSAEEVALETELRQWPRTPANDPYQAGLESLAVHLRPRLEPVRLVLAYNEFCAPTVAEAVRELAEEGVADIVVVPSMLTPGGVHAERDIPEIINALREEFPHLSLRYAWPVAGERLASFFVDHLRQFESK